MDNDSEPINDDNGRTFNPRLPAVMLPTLPPIPFPVRRFALPQRRLTLVAAFASVAGMLTAALWPWAHRESPVPVVTASLPGHGLVPNEVSNAGDRADHNLTLTGLAARPSAGITGDACHLNFPPPQIIVNALPTLLQADEPASLGLTVAGAPDGAQLVICGFAAKTVFSAGRSIDEKTWALPASEIADATIIPPRGFVGPMRLAVVLVNTDQSLADRRSLHLQWLPAPQARPGVPTTPRKTDAAELNRLLEEGVRLKAVGNLADARVIFSRVAQEGDSRAAFMLADTYDPISLAKRQLLPADSDLEQARIWYRKAFTLGSQEASGRLERLANW